MSKEAFAELIDAYADAKATKNKVLVQTMIRQLELALDSLLRPKKKKLPPKRILSKR